MTSISEALRTATQPQAMPESPTPSLKLYERAEAYSRVVEHLQENGGELTPDLEAALNAVDENFDCKAESCALYYRNLLALASGAQAEIDRLKALQKTSTTAAESLRAYIAAQMASIGKTKIHRPLAKLQFVRNSVPTISCDHPETLPKEYQHISVSYSVDRDAVLKAWREQKALPEGIKVETKSHLRIS